MADQVDRLILQAEGQKEVRELTGALIEQAKVLTDLIEQGKQYDAVTGEYTQEARAAASAVEGYARKIGEIEKASQIASKATADAGRAAIEASHAFQDFAQGGIGGVLNNLPRLAENAAKFIPGVDKLAAAFGGPLGLAAAVTTTGVAMYALTPLVKSLYETITSGSAKIPETADALDKLSTRLSEGKKALKEMADTWHGTTGEVEAYNKQLAENVRLETEANAQRERKKAIEEEAAGGKPVAGAADAAQEAIKAGGGFDVVSNEAANALNAADPELAKLRTTIVDLSNTLAKESANSNGRNQDRLDYLQSQIDKAQKAVDTRTGANNTAGVDLVGRARGGETTAIGQLAGLLPGGGFNAATPEGLKSAKESEEAAKRAEEDRKQQEKLADDRHKAALKANKKSDAERKRTNAATDRLVEEYAAGNDAIDRASGVQTRREKNAEVRRLERDYAAGSKEIMSPEETAKANQRVADGRDSADLRKIAQREYGYNPGNEMGDILKNARKYVNAGVDPGQAARAAIQQMLQTMQQLQQQSAAMNGFWNQARQQAQTTASRMSRNRP